MNAFAKNVRNEIKKSKKIYFYDNGIRNAVIQNFSGLSLRQDTGQLFENYIISEFMKANNNDLKFAKYYFWRSFQQQEIDLVEEVDGQLNIIEIKWNENKRVKFPTTFTSNYAVNRSIIINKSNYIDYFTNEGKDIKL